MNKRIAKVMMIGITSVAMVSAQELAVAEETSSANTAAAVASDAQPMIDAMAAIGALIVGADQPATDASASATAAASAPATNVAPESEENVQATVQAGQAAAANGEPTAVKKKRSAQNSVVLITGGAAAGAALGGTLGKGSKAAMIGAALGGAVGLIYDRMTYRNPGKI